MADSESDVQDIADFSLDWTIKNMCVCSWLFSPSFTAQAIDNNRWNLRLYCSNISESIELGIYRDYMGDGPDEIEVKFELSFLGIDGLPLSKELDSKQFREDDGFLFEKFADRDEVFVQKRAEFLPGGTLTVRCRMWRTGIEKVSKREMCFAHTLLRGFRGSCLSEVKDFSKLRVGQMREIILKTTAEEAFPLNVYCFLKEEDDQQYVCFGIGKKDEIHSIDGKIKICLLDAKGNVVHSEEEDAVYTEDLSIVDFFEKCKLIDSKATLLCDDMLSLKIEYELVSQVWSKPKIFQCLNYSELEESASKMDKQESSAVPSSFTEAIKILLEDGSLSDVILRAGSKSFPAHKCILFARSPVFRAIFSGDKKEKASICIEIPDLDEDTLRELLTYIYSDRVGDLQWRTAESLYKAADKFELLDLKRRCADFLKSDLSVSSVCAVLVVADLHHDQGLLEAAQDFIMRHKAEVFSTDTWRSFKEENSKLAAETMERILSTT